MFPAQPNRSLFDGLLVLRLLTAAAEPGGTRQLARDLGLEPTRVNRLAKTLAALGFLSQTPNTQGKLL
jgi:DNA-binding IclR family transcriptional regulator